MDAPLQISRERLVVEVDPLSGGRITQLFVDGTPVLVGEDDVPASLRRPDGSALPIAWGAYPMVPWAGRIRDARFDFRGETYSLPAGDGPHAIHGVGYLTAWTVDSIDPDRVRLGLDLPSDRSWPFGGRVTQEIAIGEGHVELRMDVTAGDRAFPLSFGWHPWFRKPSRFEFHPARMYRRDADGITVDDLVEVPAGPWDDCFTNTSPVALTVDGVDLRITSDCTHWVVFDELPHATCVEPQTGPPDAFHIAPFVLEPGRTRAAWARVSIGDRSA